MNAADLFQTGFVPVAQRTILETFSFTPPIDLDALVVIVGPGGSGACVINGDADAADGYGRNHAQGGNAGGTVMSRVRFRAGYTYTFTMYPGGPAVGATTNPGDSLSHVYQGNPGQGDATLSSNAPGWVDMVAKAGLGGVGWRQQSNAGADGTDHPHQTQTWGSGADFILPGGYGGEILISVLQAINLERSMATGGGAVNLMGVASEDLAGGAAILSDASSEAFIATAGAGVMGPGGDAERDAGGSDTMATGSGSAAEGGEDIVSTDAQESAGGANIPFFPSTLFPLNGAGADAVIRSATDTTNGNDGGNGSGGGSIAADSSISVGPDMLAGDAGIFAGGGAAVIAASNPQPHMVGGAGKWGGGGGGVAQSGKNTRADLQTALSGPGGDSVAFIFFNTKFGRTKA